MKPKIVKEVGRVIDYLDNLYISDLYFAQFKVQIDNSNNWHDLVIMTTEDFKKANSYVLDGQKNYYLEDQSWPNTLLQATNKGRFDSENLREFYLKGDFYYEKGTDQSANLLLLICKTAAIITIAASLVGLLVASAVLTGGLVVLGIAAFSATAALGVVGFYKVKAEEERLEGSVGCGLCFSC